MVLKAAVEGVIEEHDRERLPLRIWRDGNVPAVRAEELRKSPDVTPQVVCLPRNERELVRIGPRKNRARAIPESKRYDGGIGRC